MCIIASQTISQLEGFNHIKIPVYKKETMLIMKNGKPLKPPDSITSNKPNHNNFYIKPALNIYFKSRRFIHVGSHGIESNSCTNQNPLPMLGLIATNGWF
jgi:molybdopterin biosynthesis enzyme